MGQKRDAPGGKQGRNANGGAAQKARPRGLYCRASGFGKIDGGTFSQKMMPGSVAWFANTVWKRGCALWSAVAPRHRFAEGPEAAARQGACVLRTRSLLNALAVPPPRSARSQSGVAAPPHSKAPHPRDSLFPRHDPVEKTTASVSQNLMRGSIMTNPKNVNGGGENWGIRSNASI